MSKSKHITDRAAGKLDDAADALGMDDGEIPGPSPNPVTNMMINDIVLRSVGRISRMAVEKAILGRRYGTDIAREAVNNRSTMSALVAYGVTKFATRSIPGAAIVATGMVAKTLFDRSQSKRKAKRTGDQQIIDKANEDN